jgi:dTDP-4-dehydrorhamnose reductase
MILILGSNGMLGSMLMFVAKKYYDFNVQGLSKNEFNVLTDNINKLDTYTSENDIIINCIGAIPQKQYTEKDYYAINTTFPKQLSQYCKNKKIKLIQISTNCVFSGKKDNYKEYDIPDAEDIYGKTKFLGESHYGLIIRCSIIGPERHTFTGLMEWFLKNNSTTINGYVDSYWNGLTTLELSKIIFEKIKNNDIRSSLFHYYSDYSLSKYELLSYINTKSNKNITINKIENGIKYYTLSSEYIKPRKSIILQLDELFDILHLYKDFYNLNDKF